MRSGRLTAADYFDGQAAGWSQRYSQDGYFRERLETALKWIQHEPLESELLDYGCGSGVLLAALARAGHVVTGVDVSREMLIRARVNLEMAGIASHRFTLERVSDDFQSKYKTRVYSGIISLGTIEYVDQPMQLLSALIDCLAPGGFVILSFPNRASLLRKCERFVFTFPAPFRHLGLLPHLTGPDSYLNFQRHQFSIRELDRFFAGRGFFRECVRHYVVPRPLRPLEKVPALAMNVMVKFRRG